MVIRVDHDENVGAAPVTHYPSISDANNGVIADLNNYLAAAAEPLGAYQRALAERRQSSIQPASKGRYTATSEQETMSLTYTDGIQVFVQGPKGGLRRTTLGELRQADEARTNQANRDREAAELQTASGQ